MPAPPAVPRRAPRPARRNVGPVARRRVGPVARRGVGGASRRALALAVLVVLTVLTGCAPAPGPSRPDLRVWFMRDSVPPASEKWLRAAWQERYPGAELDIEIQDWDGIVARLQTTLASRTETADVIELGNSQALVFASVGALTDVSDLREEFGGDALIPSLVDAGSVEGRLYAAPFYAGSRVLFYRRSLLERAGVAVPTTLAEVGTAAATLTAANPDGVPGFSGLFMPARDFGSAHTWFLTHGVTYAEERAGRWVSTLGTPEAAAAIAQLQTVYREGQTTGLATLDEIRNPQVPFNAGRAAMFVGLNYHYDRLDPAVLPDVGVVAVPGLEPGTVGTAFAGGSNVAVSARSANQEHARELLELLFDPAFQEPFAADGGWVPGNQDNAGPLADTPYGPATLDAVAASAMTPAAPRWGVVEQNDVLRDFLVRLAQGGDPGPLVAGVSTQIEEVLNR